MKKKLKVLITSASYLPNIGGVENSLYYLARAGESDDVIIVASDDIVYVEDKNERPKLNCKIIRYHVPRNKNAILRLFLNWKNAFTTYKDLKKYDYDVVISRYHFNTVISYLAGLRNINFVVPGVVKYQDSKNLVNNNDEKIRKKISYRYNKLMQYIALKVSDRVFVFSENMEQQVKAVCKSCKIIRTLPGVDTDEFCFDEEKPKYKINLLTVSRLNHAKNIEMAIESLRYLPEEYNLTIVGDGPIKRDLIELSKSLQLKNRINFEGAKNNVLKYYKNTHIFLLPSIYEPFGQTILEAASCGVPVVSFDKSIVNTATYEILGSYGVYADKLDAEVYSEAISNAYVAYYCKDENLRIRIREHIKNKYSWSRLYHHITSV